MSERYLTRPLTTVQEYQRALFERGLPRLRSSWIARELQRTTDLEKLEAAALEQVDFRDSSAVEQGSTTRETQEALFSNSERFSLDLERPIFLQVVDVADVSAPSKYLRRPSGAERTLKLLLTDGQVELVAIEDAPMPELETNLTPLTKVCVRKWLLLHGMLLLRPEYVSIVRPRAMCADKR
jgi:hypothetical protein